MKQIFEIINTLKTLSGNKQLDYLKIHKDNELLKEILLYTYDTSKMYKVQEKSFNKCFEKFNTIVLKNRERTYTDLNLMSWQIFKSYLDKFSSQKGVSEADIESLIAEFWDLYDHKQLELYKAVLFKDLRINMGISSFNKVFDNFISLPQVMLAKSFSGKTFENTYCSRKFDGLRAVYLNGKFYSRTNKELSYEPLKHILEQLKDLPDHHVLDGELIYIENGKEDFKKTLSLVSAEDRREGCDNIYYLVFDMVNRKDFLNKKCVDKFELTYGLMNAILGSIIPDMTDMTGYSHTKNKNILTCSQYNKDALESLLQISKEKGWEGLMLRDADKPYECKRTSSLLKIKEMQDAEFEIMGFKAGKGKYSNTLGSITIKLDTGETVEVGSGYSDTARDNIWENQANILSNKLKLKTQFFEKTTDKKGNNSLRFPVALCFRMCDNTEISLEG